MQINPKNRFTGRYSHYKNLQPVTGGGGANNHPSTASANNRFVDQYFATYTQVLSNNTINEIKGGLNANYYTLEPIAGWGTTGSRRPPDTAQILVGVYLGPRDRGRRAGDQLLGLHRLARRPTTRSAPVSTTTRSATTSRPPSSWAGGTT